MNEDNSLPRAKILSISLPADLRSRLDAEAERRQRSRSFLVAEAVREYLSRLDRRSFDEAREGTLRDGLALSPAERLELSEELWRELARGGGLAAPWTAGFETFDEYERWRRSGARPG
jgi:predicted transcriptional regulator